jgi:hypothetical protein
MFIAELELPDLYCEHQPEAGPISSSATVSAFGISDIDELFLPQINSLRGPEQVLPIISMKSVF